MSIILQWKYLPIVEAIHGSLGGLIITEVKEVTNAAKKTNIQNTMQDTERNV